MERHFTMDGAPSRAIRRGRHSRQAEVVRRSLKAASAGSCYGFIVELPIHQGALKHGAISLSGTLISPLRSDGQTIVR